MKVPAGERPSWVDGELFPFDSHFMDLDGHRVHYVDEGNGPTLLMLHGNPTWSFLWRDVIRELSSEFRCIAIDYPGFGLSSASPGYHYLPEEHADVVTAFVDTLPITDATLVGQDWGGPIGLAVAQRRPKTFERLVLTNTWAWPTNGDLYFEGFSRIGGASPVRLLARHADLVVNTFIPMGHHRRKPSTAEMTHYRQAQATPQRRQASAILPSRVIASREFFADVECRLDEVNNLPTLIVWGGASWVFRRKELERLEATFRDHQTVTVEGAGLYVQSDAPTEFSAALRAWLLRGQS
ncbi:haloalkane dehalogenase [Gordonia sinesedis]